MVQNKAVVTVAAGKAEIQEVPYPTLPADDYMIVKVSAVALNPTDWKHIEWADQINCVGTRAGCDYAGTVVEVGPKVMKPFKKGDRVCGPVNGGNALRKEDGAFGTYIAVRGDLQIPIPKTLSDEQAATLGVSITTVGQGLYQTLSLPPPTTPVPSATRTPILLYGGSTATGIWGIQFAALSGLEVITTSSPRNFDYLRSLGATHVLDYHDADAAIAEIRRLTNNNLKLAWDCQSDAGSAAFCARSMSEQGGRYASLLPGMEEPIKKINDKIEVGSSLAYSAFGEDYAMGQHFPSKPQDFEFAKMFWELARGLLDEGRVKPIRTIVNQGGSGLEGVLVGLKDLKEGKVSGGKLVYTMDG